MTKFCTSSFNYERNITSASITLCPLLPNYLEVPGTPDFNELDGRVNTFGIIVYLNDGFGTFAKLLQQVHCVMFSCTL